MKIIAVTGTPGTGKTEIAKALAKKINYKHIELNKIIKEEKLYANYNKKLNTYETDIKKLNKYLIKLIKKSKYNLIIDSHLSHYLPKSYVDLCIVCKCDLKELKNRLEKRKYSKTKIRENMDSEIFEVCLVESVENKHKIIAVDTTPKKITQAVKEILKQL